MQEALELLELCDPDGRRLAAFGNSVREDAEVRDLCERVGYGAVMDSAARQWRLKELPDGGGIGAHTTGPAVGSVQRGVAMLRKVLGKK